MITVVVVVVDREDLLRQRAEGRQHSHPCPHLHPHIVFAPGTLLAVLASQYNPRIGAALIQEGSRNIQTYETTICDSVNVALPRHKRRYMLGEAETHPLHLALIDTSPTPSLSLPPGRPVLRRAHALECN